MDKKIEQIKDGALDQVSGGVIYDTTLITKGVDDLVHKKNINAEHAIRINSNSPLDTIQTLKGKGKEVSGVTADTQIV